MRETIGPQPGIEDLPERQRRLAVARKQVVSLIAIGQNPPGTHRDYPAFLRFTVS
jgi:hypothetical protein